MTQIITSAANVPTEATLSLLTKLIGFDTVSRNSNLELIAFLRDLPSDL